MEVRRPPEHLFVVLVNRSGFLDANLLDVEGVRVGGFE